MVKMTLDNKLVIGTVVATVLCVGLVFWMVLG